MRGHFVPSSQGAPPRNDPERSGRAARDPKRAESWQRAEGTTDALRDEKFVRQDAVHLLETPKIGRVG
jgi:hypothetical protein